MTMTRDWQPGGTVARPMDHDNTDRAARLLMDLGVVDGVWMPDPYPHAPIDGYFTVGNTVQAYLEVKAHPRPMGDTTILNVRKWRELVSLATTTELPVLFCVLYQDRIGWRNVRELLPHVKALPHRLQTDTRSVRRSTSTEPVLDIPTPWLARYAWNA